MPFPIPAKNTGHHTRNKLKAMKEGEKKAYWLGTSTPKE